MYVADRETFDDAFCGDCGKIMDSEDCRKYQGLCEECHIVKDYPFLKDADALQKHLENIIPVMPPGRAEYTTLPRKPFTTEAWNHLIGLLGLLQERETIGYRENKESVNIVLKFRRY